MMLLDVLTAHYGNEECVALLELRHISISEGCFEAFPTKHTHGQLFGFSGSPSSKRMTCCAGGSDCGVVEALDRDADLDRFDSAEGGLETTAFI